MFEFSSLPPLALYVHIPWCVRKCPYCDFNSHAVKDKLPEREYIDALLRDLDMELPLVWGRKLESVFIGGGTPSLFSAQAIERLLSGIRARMRCRPAMEITLEANPGTVEQGRFAEYKAAGVNRLSIGVQSFDALQLRTLGRIHDAGEAQRAAESAHAAGLENFNLDLMFGLPGQHRQQALQDLSTAFELKPAHISWYQLTLEPNTWFYRHPPKLPSHDRLWDIQQAGQAALQEHGYTRYEVSAYASAARHCRHNLNYWEFGDYMGIGAGAHGKISDAQRGTIVRRWRVRHPKAYLDVAGSAAGLEGENSLTRADVVFEFMLNALRLDQGFTQQTFEHRTGLPLSTVQGHLRRAEKRELLNCSGDYYRPTELGQRFLNDLAALFLEEPDDVDGG